MSKTKENLGTVTKNRAIKIFEALGFKTANKWDTARLQKKLIKLEMLVEGAELDKKNQKRVNEILRAQKKGRKVTVIDVENAAANKQRERDVEEARKREKQRKTEKGKQSVKKEKVEVEKKLKKTAAAKKQEKRIAEKKESAKPGLMMSMYEFIQMHQPISTKKILSLLKKRFPDKNPESMERCIPRYPKCLAESKGINDISQDDKERYIIVKKSKK